MTLGCGQQDKRVENHAAADSQPTRSKLHDVHSARKTAHLVEKEPRPGRGNHRARTELGRQCWPSTALGTRQSPLQHYLGKLCKATPADQPQRVSRRAQGQPTAPGHSCRSFWACSSKMGSRKTKLFVPCTHEIRRRWQDGAQIRTGRVGALTQSGKEVLKAKVEPCVWEAFQGRLADC